MSDELVVAAAEVLEDWLPGFDGTVVYVPSLDTNRILVADFARRLTDLIGARLSDCVKKVHRNEPQKLMENSATQLRNVNDAFQIHGHAPTGPVILVDDIVDSRWTITVLGELLMAAGSGPIYPFALAKVKG
ncbi:hypothetical protein [Mycobacterium sp.]|uniref:hypothetical protein n=1 Tax=Mycobacterium sp. TaxID=1785 RepID=UPI003D1275FE